MPDQDHNRTLYPHTVPDPHTSAHSGDRGSDRQFSADSGITSAAIACWEADVRALLDYYKNGYLPPHLVHPVRRLRLLVG